MKALEITRDQFDEFKKLQVKKRWDWPATFSTNSQGSIWPYVTNGRTPIEDRNNVRGESPLLDEIADRYTTMREEGGRFFIGWNGAFWRSENDDRPQTIVSWKDMRPQQRQLTLSERLKERADIAAKTALDSNNRSNSNNDIPPQTEQMTYAELRAKSAIIREQRKATNLKKQ